MTRHILLKAYPGQTKGLSSVQGEPFTFHFPIRFLTASR